jgi:YD repeat-containing protein
VTSSRAGWLPVPGTSATLGYDPEGRPVRTTETNLLYDGQNLVAEYDGAGHLAGRYAFGPGVDEPLVQYEGGGLGFADLAVWRPAGQHRGAGRMRKQEL